MSARRPSSNGRLDVDGVSGSEPPAPDETALLGENPDALEIGWAIGPDGEIDREPEIVLGTPRRGNGVTKGPPLPPETSLLLVRAVPRRPDDRDALCTRRCCEVMERADKVALDTYTHSLPEGFEFFLVSHVL